MANATYDALWQEAIGELGEQLHVEGADDGDEGGETVANSGPAEVTIYQAFQHFACLYIKYLQILRKLESCYDCMIHPQKRLSVKNVLELVIRRVIELKADLVKWNPPNSYLKIPQGPEEAFPWEYVHLDDILVDLKLSPETLEIAIPKYFKEDSKRQLDQRDRIVSGFMRLKHNVDKLLVPDAYDSAVVAEQMTLDRAIEIIQRNERGRQGFERAAIVRALREKERQGRLFESSARMEMDSELAATTLQRMLKGFISRTEAAKERENELMFIGMKPRKDNLDSLEHELQLAYVKRKQEQMENKEAYEKALDDLKEIIADEEGPEKREEFREERTLWVTDQIAQEKFPEDLEDFYKTKMFVKEEPADAMAETKGGKDDKKKKDAKADKKGDDKKGKKDAKGAKEEKEPEAMPKLQGKTELTEAMSKLVEEFEAVWDGKDESDNFQQKHDVELAKTVVRPGVYEEIRKQVDEMLIMNLKKIKMQVAPGGKGKGKKGGKKGKKKGGKKGKKGGKKKALPGEKIGELKGMEADQMLSILVDHQLVVKPRPRTINSLIGEFNYLGSVHHMADRKDEGAWEPQDPSIAQIRQNLSEYCILPNGSAEIKAKCKVQVKTVMLYGPSGSGKTHAVEAVAHELGALMIHLSPAKLRGQFPGKQGPTKLVHLVMKVAMDPAMQPVVVYIDECEQFFSGGKKNKDKDGPSRFKKDLQTYKNQALTNEHRVIIIGTTKNPENGDLKDLKAFFDKFLYMPYPDYASRVLIWKHYLVQKIREGVMNNEASPQGNNNNNNNNAQQNKSHISDEEIAMRVRIGMERLDPSSLAHISEGYSAGAIARTVRLIVTHRRVAMLRLRPLLNVDFIDSLAMQEVSYQDDKTTFMEFTKAITGLADRRKKIEQIISGEANDTKKDKKGGDKKGKKK